MSDPRIKIEGCKYNSIKRGPLALAPSGLLPSESWIILPMGFIYRKSVKAGPFRLNLGEYGFGLSAAGAGLSMTESSTGSRYTTFKIPGSSMSCRTSSEKSQGCISPIVGFLRLAAGGVWFATNS